MNNLEKHFRPLKEYLKAVINSKENLHSLFVYSEGGLGKTHTTLQTLKELKKIENEDFIYLNNYSTPVAFINLLYKNKDKIIIMDDTEEMWKAGAKVFNILKGALWGAGDENKRLVTYNTTDKRLTAPSQFEFSGKLIFLLNKMPNEKDVLVRALLTRSLVYNIHFTYKEKIEIITEFSKLPYGKLTDKERKERLDYLIKNSDETTEELNLRTLIKIYDLSIVNKDNWKELSKTFLKKDENLSLIIAYLEEGSVKEAQIKWCNETGMSRASYFRYKVKSKNL